MRAALAAPVRGRPGNLRVIASPPDRIADARISMIMGGDPFSVLDALNRT
jgi:hypothetical protein